jgi:hypothetical protein
MEGYTAAAVSSAGAESPYSMITFYRDLYLFVVLGAVLQHWLDPTQP